MRIIKKATKAVGVFLLVSLSPVLLVSLQSYLCVSSLILLSAVAWEFLPCVSLSSLTCVSPVFLVCLNGEFYSLLLVCLDLEFYSLLWLRNLFLPAWDSRELTGLERLRCVCVGQMQAVSLQALKEQSSIFFWHKLWCSCAVGWWMKQAQLTGFKCKH
jgi:hypothetical protein